jgi:hypothetical protein
MILCLVNTLIERAFLVNASPEDIAPYRLEPVSYFTLCLKRKKCYILIRSAKSKLNLATISFSWETEILLGAENGSLLGKLVKRAFPDVLGERYYESHEAIT